MGCGLTKCKNDLHCIHHHNKVKDPEVRSMH